MGTRRRQSGQIGVGGDYTTTRDSGGPVTGERDVLFVFSCQESDLLNLTSRGMLTQTTLGSVFSLLSIH